MQIFCSQYRQTISGESGLDIVQSSTGSTQQETVREDAFRGHIGEIVHLVSMRGEPWVQQEARCGTKGTIWKSHCSVYNTLSYVYILGFAVHHQKACECEFSKQLPTAFTNQSIGHYSEFVLGIW